MSMKEITAAGHSLLTLDNLSFTEEEAKVIFRFLLSMGATKNIKMYLCPIGTIKIMKPFKYPLVQFDKNRKLYDGEAEGQQYYGFEKFLRVLIRFDKSAHKRMKNVERKVSQMHAGISALTKQL